ncbi:MAG: DUF2147 domain-containing protein [Neisseria sp.]|nr:DUF2147 domain-containing protein [Neisseria sp.]
MNKTLLALLLAFGVSAVQAEGIVGKWKTIDDETGKARSIVSISEVNGQYQGKIVELMPNVPNKCPGCDGSSKTFGVAKDGPIVGMTILRNLKADGDKYSGGSVFDPKSGKTYKGSAKLSGDGQKLVLRGYVGVGVLSVGRSQTWQRIE